MMKRAPGIFGSVTAVNGTTLTVTGRGFASSTAQTVYTVDATNATVVKDRATSTVSAIVVGDNVMVAGTINGTSVAATKIFDGVMGMMGRPGNRREGGFKDGTSTPMSSGNGQPIIGGTVSAVGGATITITNKSAAYTIDASSAKITKNGAAGSISDIATGDSILAQGTVNGTSVTAVNVTDNGAANSGANMNGTTTDSTPGSHPMGFFGRIGSFFAHLFGF
jgi:hypothetical protein